MNKSQNMVKTCKSLQPYNNATW